jgi:hypothetical protein
LYNKKFVVLRVLSMRRAFRVRDAMNQAEKAEEQETPPGLWGRLLDWPIATSMAVLMPSAHGLPSVTETGLPIFLARLRRQADPLYWFGLWLGAWVFQLTPPLTLGLPLPAFALPARLATRHAERIVSTRFYLLRQAVFLLRLNAGMCWGADPNVRARFALAPYAADPGSFRES